MSAPLKFKYDMETLQLMASVEKITKARVKDCIISGEKMFFVVEKGHLFRALGQNKKNITRLEDLLKKKVKMIEYTEDKMQFIKNVLAPLRVVEMKEEDGVITITGPDTKTKGLMIGARAANLRLFESIVQKFYSDVKELRVI